MAISDKQQVFINNYCTNGHNGLKAYRKAYPDASDESCKASASRLLYNVNIKQAISEYKAETKAKLEHNRQIAIDMLTEDRTLLIDQAKAGNISAIQARTAITRELNAISNLHSATITTKSDSTTAIDTELQAELQAVAQRYKLRKANEQSREEKTA